MPKISRRRARRPQGAPDYDQQAIHSAALHHGSVYRPHRGPGGSSHPAGAARRPSGASQAQATTAAQAPGPARRPHPLPFDEAGNSLDEQPLQEHRPSPANTAANAPGPPTTDSPATTTREPVKPLYTHLSVDPGTEILTEDGPELWAPTEDHSTPRNGRAPRDEKEQARVTPSSAIDFIRDDTGQAMIGTLAGLREVDDVEAGTFAVRFACDFLSWDQDETQRRSHVLRTYLAAGHSSTLGWNGAGRQRADAPTYGRMERRSPTTVIVEVWVRITPYDRTSQDSSARAPASWSDNGMPPSSAPAPHAAGWAAGAAYWLSMAVPVTRDHTDPGGRLVVNPSLIPTATP